MYEPKKSRRPAGVGANAGSGAAARAERQSKGGERWRARGERQKGKTTTASNTMVVQLADPSLSLPAGRGPWLGWGWGLVGWLAGMARQRVATALPPFLPVSAGRVRVSLFVLSLFFARCGLAGGSSIGHDGQTAHTFSFRVTFPRKPPPVCLCICHSALRRSSAWQRLADARTSFVCAANDGNMA